MAPESERAMKRTIYCHGCSEAGGADKGVYHLPPECKSTNPTAPATCSEVVERLAKIAENEPIHYPDDGGPLHPHTVRSNIENKLRSFAPAILHSWRERRVQEGSKCSLCEGRCETCSVLNAEPSVADCAGCKFACCGFCGVRRKVPPDSQEVDRFCKDIETRVGRCCGDNLNLSSSELWLEIKGWLEAI